MCSAGPDATAPLDASTTPDAPTTLDSSATPDAPRQATPDAAAGMEAGLPCGPGTYPSNGECVPVSATDGGLAYYDLRVAVTTVPGDGMTMVPILALGRLADGSSSNEQVVFSLSRPGAGTITPSTQLTPTGATVYFVPCNAAVSSACTGTVQVLMAASLNAS